MSVDISSDSRVHREALLWRVNDLCPPRARAGQGRARQCGQANGPWQGAAHQKNPLGISIFSVASEIYGRIASHSVA